MSRYGLMEKDNSEEQSSWAGEMTTIIPCTEESSARTSGLVPHPLVDKLQYVAEIIKIWGEKESCWDKYILQLEKWCNSPYGNPEINAVLNYLKKGTLIRDLVNEKILLLMAIGICSKNGVEIKMMYRRYLKV